MTRTITTAAELDALPVGSVVRTARGSVATRHESARGTVLGWLVAGYFGPQVLYADTDLPAVVLYDPSAPVVPVVPDAAVEAAARAVAVLWGAPGVPDVYRSEARAALSAALPFLGAAPSATREDVDLTAVLRRVWDDGNATGLEGVPGRGITAGAFLDAAVRHRERSVRRALDAITPKEKP